MVLAQTLASPQVLVCGLYYLSRLPVTVGTFSILPASAFPPVDVSLHGATATPCPLWHVGREGNNNVYFEAHDRAVRAKNGFVLELFTENGLLGNNQDAPFRLFALALMLGNKWFDDHTFTNKTWYVLSLFLFFILFSKTGVMADYYDAYLGMRSPTFPWPPSTLWRTVLSSASTITSGSPTMLGATGFRRSASQSEHP